MGDTVEKRAGAGSMSATQRAWIQGFLGIRVPEEVGGGGPAADGGGGKAPAATATDLFFDKDSSTLTPSAQGALDRYASAYIAAAATDPITIEAWASKEGDPGHNKDLANARAKAVADYLAGKGISKERLKATGRGATEGFSKDDLAQNRRATLAPPPPAATPPGTPPPAQPGPGDTHMPTGLRMREGGRVKDPLGTEEAVKHVVGEGTDVPRAQVERELKDWLTALSGNQPNMRGKVRGTDIVAEAERRLHKGLPGAPLMPRGDGKDYEPGALAKRLADNLPPMVPGENVAEFRKLSTQDAPKERTTAEALHDKYKEERDELTRKLPKSLQDWAKKGLDAVVEKGAPYVLDKGLGAANVDSKLQGEVKDFAEKWAKKVTGNEDQSGDK